MHLHRVVQVDAFGHMRACLPICNYDHGASGPKINASDSTKAGSTTGTTLGFESWVWYRGFSSQKVKASGCCFRVDDASLEACV